MDKNIFKNKNPISLRLGQSFLTNGLGSNRSNFYKSLFRLGLVPSIENISKIKTHEVWDLVKYFWSMVLGPLGPTLIRTICLGPRVSLGLFFKMVLFLNGFEFFRFWCSHEVPIVFPMGFQRFQNIPQHVPKKNNREFNMWHCSYQLANTHQLTWALFGSLSNMGIG